MDERPWQLIDAVLVPIPMKPGRSKRQDYEYKRHGTCGVFLAFDPGRPWRFVQVRARRTAVDYALLMTQLVAQYDPRITRIRLVQANLNTPTPGAFYSAFPPPEAFEWAQKFELHYTPVKGRWLKMAEIDLAALSTQCLERRIGDLETLAHEVAAWNDTRNRACKTVRWKFTKTAARRKLHNKYPVGQD